VIDAAIISTGDELTTGRTTDTNAGFIADRLLALGVDVVAILTVGDRTERLRWAWTVRTCSNCSPQPMLHCTGPRSQAGTGCARFPREPGRPTRCADTPNLGACLNLSIRCTPPAW